MKKMKLVCSFRVPWKARLAYLSIYHVPQHLSSSNPSPESLPDFFILPPKPLPGSEAHCSGEPLTEGHLACTYPGP